MKNILKVGVRSKNIRYRRRYKALFEKQETRFICKFWSISMLLDPDPDPHGQNAFESGSTTLDQTIPNVSMPYVTVVAWNMNLLLRSIPWYCTYLTKNFELQNLRYYLVWYPVYLKIYVNQEPSCVM
jgi:hypothetical protein